MNARTIPWETIADWYAKNEHTFRDVMKFEGLRGVVNEALRLAPDQPEIEKLKSDIANLESMRPHWAKGYSSDSMAAQGQTSALSQVWELLGVDNQTDCMTKLRVVWPDGHDAHPVYDCCANCMRIKALHTNGRCLSPYTTVWHEWDYVFAPGGWLK